MAPGALYTIVLDPEGSYITGYGVNGGVLAASDGCLDGLATSGSKVVRSHLTGSADTVEMAYQGGVFTSGDDRMVVTGMLDGWVLSDPLSTGNASATFVPATGSADFVVYSV